jgi:hypothetical protein
VKDFLRKLKLIEDQTTILDTSKNEFVPKFKRSVDESDLGFFSDSFDVFSSSSNEYKGHVDFNGFKIKRRRRFFDTNMNWAVAKGEFINQNEKLIIKTEINGFSRILIPFIVFLLIFYLLFLGGFSYTLVREGDAGESFVFLLFVIIHAAFMFGIPYIVMRRSTSRMKRELEREFYYIMQKSESTVL